MVLNEQQIKNIISEAIQEYISEEQLKRKIKNIVKEELSLNMFSQLEKKGDGEEKEEKKREKRHSDDGRLSDMNVEGEYESEKRDSIESFFKQDEVNNAPYAYDLYGVNNEKGKDTNEKKNARKKFSACLNHEKNEDGYPYSFSSSELNHLSNAISGNKLK